MWLHPYMFGVSVVLMIIVLFVTVKAYKAKSTGALMDLSMPITALGLLTAYCSMSFLFLVSHVNTPS